ncbi:Undecaprenyl pyrophosphate synthetase 2 (UPP synthetase 2) (Di-trans,poly-cis-decaprenylcistransferase 2) (Undecaprenyl diphosphate synthase 2) (UDS 2) [Pseudorhizobium banfieldiae]|uniref:Isoprenyl transferase n=1 Tax=Pseudorhizobium banfieldiae TaxID=1125847 RepID=L0NGA2_9HYPH|nr:isoprenyl transferase [Pseudorhizobium banfieldiae]CAD6607022.1 di-trans,poly-cis-decaprenylcistransferase [arsenite-oxidising bacterium NT-25]CCF19327.1 Undecaprenyl pyrophosphate synthetase 2 (UPP synthetase 2) (Di-trans,poly-cis-decaprenylcistransferase 2) (Undecaprenyl diphosphate synthase 2) (UDS 2) [Pseudorhizobium banfieldiae]
MAKLDLPIIPQHVAIIMDGNGRWAKQRGLPRTIGHNKGVEAVRQAVRAAGECGVKYLTLFAFSSENWSRPEAEIEDLLGLLRRFIRRDLADLHRENIRIRIIGERQKLRSDILPLLLEAEETTRNNTAMTLIIAFNYGARDEITRAAIQLVKDVQAGLVDPQDITPDAIGSRLDTAGIPDPDLIIRTSGEERLSNFLLWQAAYSEFVFLPCYWPDFDRQHFVEALRIFAARDRRFGGLSDATTAVVV